MSFNKQSITSPIGLSKFNQDPFELRQSGLSQYESYNQNYNQPQQFENQNKYEQNNTQNKRLFKNVSQLILTSSQQPEYSKSNNQSYIDDQTQQSKRMLDSVEKKKRNDMITKWITGNDDKNSLKEILNQFEGPKDQLENRMRKGSYQNQKKQEDISPLQNNSDQKYNLAQKYFQNQNPLNSYQEKQIIQSPVIKRIKQGHSNSNNAVFTQEDEIVENHNFFLPKIMSSEQSIYIPSIIKDKRNSDSSNSSQNQIKSAHNLDILQFNKKGILKRSSYLSNNEETNNKQQNYTENSINGHRKVKSMFANRDFIIGEAKKQVNFKETLRVIELESGTERQDKLRINFAPKLYKKRTQNNSATDPIILDKNY